MLYITKYNIRGYIKWLNNINLFMAMICFSTRPFLIGKVLTGTKVLRKSLAYKK